MLEILDTAGQEEYSVMRDQYMRSGDGFLLVYSIDSRASFESISSLRDAVIRAKDDDKVPIVIAGAKCDLEATRTVFPSEGSELAKYYNCPFLEVSAKTRTRVEDAFFALIKQMRGLEDSKNAPQGEPSNKKDLKAKSSNKSKCSIL